MLMQRADVAQLVLTVLNEQLVSQNIRLPNALNESTPLIGRDSLLDSLGLVNLIVSIEYQLETEHGTPLTLVDERAMSLRNSPFRTVGTLADYIRVLLQDGAAHDGA